MAINFAIIQTAPGGPVEKLLSKINHDIEINGDVQEASIIRSNPQYQSSLGIDPEIILKIEKDYGFDKSPLDRFWLMLIKFIKFDFGNSFLSR